MIPAHNHSHVLPPFVGNTPTDRSRVSPYDTTLCAIVGRFSTNPDRVSIIKGLLDFRLSLISAGIVNGYQWLSGSFTENVEILRGRPPADIDVITVAHRPSGIRDNSTWVSFFDKNQDLFDPSVNKQKFMCDAYYIDLGAPAENVVLDVSYWYGLFSHRRDGLWKGMLRISLQADDAEARTTLAGGA